MTLEPLPNGTGSPTEARERNWLPLAVAAGAVLLAIGLAVAIGGRHKAEPAAIDAPADAYAAKLTMSDLAMSESGNLAGGKVTYIDGRIANRGDRIVSGITVQVVFRNYAKEVAQNQTLPLTLVRMREPYIDTEPVSAAPLKPGSEHDFRLIFDSVSADWDGATPEIRVLQVEFK